MAIQTEGPTREYGLTLKQYKSLQDDLINMFPDVLVGALWDAAAQIKNRIHHRPKKIWLSTEPFNPSYYELTLCDFFEVTFGKKFIFWKHRVYVQVVR